MESMPDFLHMDDPTRNLAGLSATPNWPVGQSYYAIDGTPIGRGVACDPITDEPDLSGFDAYERLAVPAVLSDNRIDWGEDFAVPLMIGSIRFVQSGSALNAALWALAGYMVPYGVAAVVAFRSYQAYQRGPTGVTDVWGS
jgi:hypothetical protein